MRVQAALNGARDAGEHAGVPLDAEALARDAAACAAAGATSVHLHPRGGDGGESLEPSVVDSVARAVRDASGVPVGVTTGEWIVRDVQERIALVRGWSAPAFASVNLAEAGCEDVMRALTENGIGIEAGLASAADAQRLVRSGLAETVLRCLVEPYGTDRPQEALDECAAIHAVLDDAGVAAPRLQHSDGPAAWPVLADALDRGLDTRIGFEDVLTGPAGQPVESNAELVRLALALP